MIPLDDRQVRFVVFRDPAERAKSLPVERPSIR
jgi:hypothetical protein